MRAVELVALTVGHAFYHTGLYDDVFLVIHHRVELLGGESEQVANLVGQ